MAMNDWNQNGKSDLFDSFNDYQNYKNSNNSGGLHNRGCFKNSTLIMLIIVIIVSLFSDTIALIILLGYGFIKLIS